MIDDQAMSKQMQDIPLEEDDIKRLPKKVFIRYHPLACELCSDIPFIAPWILRKDGFAKGSIHRSGRITRIIIAVDNRHFI